MVKTHALAFVVVLGLLVVPLNAAPVIKKGEPFPVIDLPTADGTMMSIAGFRGTRMLLHIFASW